MASLQISRPQLPTREYKVFDGTFHDYALLSNGQPVLFLEAKALGSDLGDPRFTAQTVNYANNEGMEWCVLGTSQRHGTTLQSWSAAPDLQG